MLNYSLSLRQQYVFFLDCRVQFYDAVYFVYTFSKCIMTSPFVWFYS